MLIDHESSLFLFIYFLLENIVFFGSIDVENSEERKLSWPCSASSPSSYPACLTSFSLLLGLAQPACYPYWVTFLLSNFSLLPETQIHHLIAISYHVLALLIQNYKSHHFSLEIHIILTNLETGIKKNVRKHPKKT